MLPPLTKGLETDPSEPVGPSPTTARAASLTFVSLALVGVGAGGCDAQDAADGVGGASRVRAHRGHLRHGARGHCAEGEDGQGPAGGLAWGGRRLRGGGRLGPSHRAKQRHSPNTSLVGRAERVGGVPRMPPPEQQPHLEDKNAPPPKRTDSSERNSNPAYPRMQEAGGWSRETGELEPTASQC